MNNEFFADILIHSLDAHQEIDNTASDEGNENPYYLGYQAAFDGSKNPFDSHTGEWREWEEGFTDSMNENFVDWFDS